MLIVLKLAIFSFPSLGINSLNNLTNKLILPLLLPPQIIHNLNIPLVPLPLPYILNHKKLQLLLLILHIKHILINISIFVLDESVVEGRSVPAVGFELF